MKLTMADKIKMYRMAASYSQIQAAEALGLTLVRYQLFERGKLVPSVQLCIDMAELFKVRPEDFCDSDGSIITLPVRLENSARPPKKDILRGTFMLYSNTDAYLRPNSMTYLETGVGIAIPEGYIAAIGSAVTLTERFGITADGVITPADRGSIKIPLFNHGDTGCFIPAGSHIADVYIVPTQIVQAKPCAGEEG